MKATKCKIVPRRESSHYAQSSHGQHGQCRHVPGARGAGLTPSSTTASLQCSKNHAKELTPKLVGQPEFVDYGSVSCKGLCQVIGYSWEPQRYLHTPTKEAVSQQCCDSKHTQMPSLRDLLRLQFGSKFPRPSTGKH